MRCEEAASLKGEEMKAGEQSGFNGYVIGGGTGRAAGSAESSELRTEAPGLSRRDLFKFSGMTAVGMMGAAALAGCAPKGKGSSKADSETARNAASWRDAPDPITDVASEADYDLVVVGAGNGGLVAAMTAQQKGFKVCVLEKSRMIAAAREAIGTIGSRYSKGHEVDVPELMNFARRVQSGDVNMALYKTWAEKSGEFMDWLGDLEEPMGMTFPFEYHAPDPSIAPEAYYPPMCVNPVMGEFNPNGPNYGAYVHLEVLRDLFLEAGGVIEYETPAKQLVQDESGKVSGVIARNADKQHVRYNAAKGVILCTGGYGANKEMMMDLCPNAYTYSTATAATTEEGDGIRMALWAGAQLEEGGGAMVWNRAVVGDDCKLGADLNNAMFLPASQPFLRVNARGERFMNEDSTYPEIFAQGQYQPGGYSWQVFDSTYWEDIVRFDTCGCSRLAPAPDGSAFNADVYDLEALTKEHLDSFWFEPVLADGTMKKCDTLEELADAMAFGEQEKKTFLASVKRYNELVSSGKDLDFGKEAFRCSTVDEAPFYAIRTAGNLLVTIHGVITDTNSQPLRADGSAIEGLYVCGNDQGGFYPHNYPSMFTGINAGRTATFARIAAKHACGIA